MLAVWKKEVQSYFLSPIAYIFMAVFMLVTGLFFVLTNVLGQSAEFNSTLSNIAFMFILVVPVLTMRLLSEEKRSKTDQLLLTSPISLTAVVVGKYLAALTVFAATLVLSLVYPLVLAIFGNPAFGEIFAGYLGFALLGCSLIALGLFMSALCENQVTAAVSTFGVILVVWMGSSILSSINIPWLNSMLSWLAIYGRFTGFVQGIIGLAPTFYYLSVSALFVFLTIRTVEKRRWSEG